MVGEPTKSEDSLFSIELVIEKLYVPHTPCRFPAIAFRLLDFPTIVIKHVEDDLSRAKRSKISFDPYYQLPDQFSELKDRHGNFMINKGKSCLFKILPDTLKQHLTSTPLYVMVIDLFPEVPKLIGNSTVPLNSLMDSICIDIAKLGSTVPSVHGDKGLFKLYNLMGKEMGYFVLGFRLLCLGPSLSLHLPDSALMHRQPKKSEVREARQIGKMIERQGEDDAQSSDGQLEHVAELRNSACMTDAIKHDVLLQTVEMEDKAVHVCVSGRQDSLADGKLALKETEAASTQTERKKMTEKVLIARKKWVEKVEHKVDDDDILINNIVCPPPLFYNSEANPPIEIEHHQEAQSQYGDNSFEDLSDIESYDGHGLHTKSVSKDSDQQIALSPQSKITEQTRQSKVTARHIPQARVGELIHGLQVAPCSNDVFPLLTALIKELSHIQDPQFLLGISNKLARAPPDAMSKPQNVAKHIQLQHKELDGKLPPSAVSAVASALARKFDDSKDISKPSKPQSTQPSSKAPISGKDKILTKNAQAAKKTKLVYGLTNTQRLRLQKTNPAWLKLVEKEVDEMKAKKLQNKNPPNVDDVNVTNFSDTLTEVRRLAERELESTAGGDTLLLVASEAEAFNSTAEQYRDSLRSPKKQHHRSDITKSQTFRKGKGVDTPEKIPSNQFLRKTPSPKSRQRKRYRRVSQKRDHKDSSDSDGPNLRKPAPLEQSMKGMSSPSLDKQEVPETPWNIENEDGLSARSDLPSSRSRSIEVRLPSAHPDFDDSATITDAENSEDDEDDDNIEIPLPDDSVSENKKPLEVNLPRYFSRDTSLPDSIEGVPNASLNISAALDDNSPLESTRHSTKNLTEDQNDSRVLHSTDYDTRQFHSTDEPELQGLISEENRSEGTNSGRRSVASVRTSQKFPVINPQASENSPVPSVRRSTTKLDPGALSYLPSMSLSKGQGSPGSSRPGTPKGSYSNSNKNIPLNPRSGVITPRSMNTPRSASPSPRRPTPRQKRPLRDFRESINTESLSSYMPSDPENAIVSLSSNSGNYSDDFLPMGSGDSGGGASSVEQLPKIKPLAKLGYTMH